MVGLTEDLFGIRFLQEYGNGHEQFPERTRSGDAPPTPPEPSGNRAPRRCGPPRSPRVATSWDLGSTVSVARRCRLPPVWESALTSARLVKDAARVTALARAASRNVLAGRPDAATYRDGLTGGVLGVHLSTPC